MAILVLVPKGKSIGIVQALGEQLVQFICGIFGRILKIDLPGAGGGERLIFIYQLDGSKNMRITKSVLF